MELARTYEKNLTPDLDREIIDIQHVAFPYEVDFDRVRWWHTPPKDDDLWFGARVEGLLVGSVRVLHRTILTPAGEFTIAGLGNVCSHPKARGAGAAKACMRDIASYLTQEAGADFGVLFCGPEIRGFYDSLDWQAVDNDVVYIDPEGKRATPGCACGHGHMMIHPGRRALEDWPEGRIDLNGPDW